MATLADSGSTQVNENNPYNLALANARNEQAVNPAASTPNQPAPNNKESIGPSSGSPLIGSDLATGLGTTPAIPDDSTLDTPEQAPAKQQAKQQQGADLQAINHAISPKTAKAPALPTEQQDVNAALAPDEALLDQLPQEYKSVMGQLAPYINSGNTAADKAVATEIDKSNGPVEKALTEQGKAVKEYAGSVPYQGILQALLGYGKYQETYEGVLPKNTGDWSDQMKDIYDYLSGLSTAATGNVAGLPSPTVAATQPGAGTITSSGDTAGGGNG
jgi:hypothetical protein